MVKLVLFPKSKMFLLGFLWDFRFVMFHFNLTYFLNCMDVLSSCMSAHHTPSVLRRPMTEIIDGG